MTKVLYLAANPTDTPALRLDVECRAIAEAIRAGRYRDRIAFVTRWAARADDLLASLGEETPQVLHFSGHGDGDAGLSFERETGGSEPVGAGALARVFAAAGGSVKLVVLNACYSEVQADAVRAHVPCVVGVRGAIGDGDGTRYVVALYRALAAGGSVANAHQQGLAALALHAAPDPDAVVLRCRDGVDPARIRVVEDPPAGRRWIALALAALVLVGGAAFAYHQLTSPAPSRQPEVGPGSTAVPDRPPDIHQEIGPGAAGVIGDHNTTIIDKH